MKVNYHYEIYLLAIFMFALTISGLWFLQTFSPNAYNQITGNQVIVATTVNITPGIIYDCSFPVVAGMNLVSISCIGEFETLTDIITDTTDTTGIFGYDETDSTDPWKVYKPDKPNYVVDDLSILSKLDGYWFKMNGSRTFAVSGILAFSTDVPLVSGYQLVGYPDNETENITVSFSNTSVSKVVGHVAGTTTFLIYVPNGSGNTLDFVEPGKGYWVNGTTSENWVVS